MTKRQTKAPKREQEATTPEAGKEQRRNKEQEQRRSEKETKENKDGVENARREKIRGTR